MKGWACMCMERKADIEQRIFVMLIPEHPTVELAKQFQEEVNRKYGLYRILPTLHITLESIYVNDEDDIDQAVRVVDEVCRELDSFPIVVNGFACFGPPYKSVQLHVVKTPPLVALYENLHRRLAQAGLRLREYPEGVQFHMTIASPCFAEREWTLEEYSQACEELKSLSVHSGFVLKHLEMWYPKVEPEKRLLACFLLRH